MVLHQESCSTYSKNANKLNGNLQKEYLQQLSLWKIQKKKLCKRFSFANFTDALDFVNKIAIVAEKENHHPNISFSWGFVEIAIYTHSISHLSICDFILAAKIDELSYSRTVSKQLTL